MCRCAYFHTTNSCVTFYISTYNYHLLRGKIHSLKTTVVTFSVHASPANSESCFSSVIIFLIVKSPGSAEPTLVFEKTFYVQKSCWGMALGVNDISEWRKLEIHLRTHLVRSKKSVPRETSAPVFLWCPPCWASR